MRSGRDRIVFVQPAPGFPEQRTCDRPIRTGFAAQAVPVVLQTQLGVQVERARMLGVGRSGERVRPAGSFPAHIRVQAPAPAHIVEGGLPTDALVAQIVVAKYADHCPLYRQIGIFARQGVELDRSTLADWVGRAAGLFLLGLEDVCGASWPLA